MNDMISFTTQTDTRHQDFLQRLKTLTAPQHAALESQPLLNSLMTPLVNEKGYCDYLLRMKKILEAYENNVVPCLNRSDDFHQRSLSGLIENDLLQLSFNTTELNTLPDFDLPQNIGEPFAWGFAYVIEGSKLGGRVIFKHLQKLISIREDDGGAYLANKGADTGTEWKAFLHDLSSYTIANDCEQEVIDGAIFGFTSIHNYFETNNSEK